MTDFAYQQRTDRYIALINRHERLLFWLCYRHARYRRELTLDCQQDVLTRLWVTLDSLPVTSSLRQEKAWVRWQARSVLSNLRRDAKPKALPLSAAGPLPDDDSRHEARELLDELMAYLAEEDRSLLQRQLEGYSVVEIAATLGVTPHAVAQRLLRARLRLRQVYEKLYNN